MRAYERLLKYVSYDTTSAEDTGKCPSSPNQLVLGRYLAEELKALGLADAHMDAHGYVYASIPANRKGLSAVGLIAHMDTSNAVSAKNVQPRVIENYDGGEITLESGDILSPAAFPELKKRAGKSLIVTDGHTLLGADDKAGIAEIMTACERVLSSDAPHGKICIAFTPDEEIGCGADLFDVPAFGADYAFTVDGDEVGGIEYENFNAATAKIAFSGRSVHPGSAKDRMINAARLAAEFDARLPQNERPEHTEGYEGFYHLCGFSGEVERAGSVYILRDHDAEKFARRKETVLRVAQEMNEKYGAGCVTCEIEDSYANMREIIEQHPEILERARAAYRKTGVEPFCVPIRGGTDGSRLSFMGLPCPNLATGGMNFHSRLECIAIEDMDTMTDMLVALVTEE